jgi:hypothetical protein
VEFQAKRSATKVKYTASEAHVTFASPVWKEYMIDFARLK